MCLPAADVPSYVSSTCGKDSQPVGGVVVVHGKVERCVVSVLVMLNAMVSCDVCHWAAVDGKQRRSK